MHSVLVAFLIFSASFLVCWTDDLLSRMLLRDKRERMKEYTRKLAVVLAASWLSHWNRIIGSVWYVFSL